MRYLASLRLLSSCLQLPPAPASCPCLLPPASEPSVAILLQWHFRAKLYASNGRLSSRR